MNKQDLRVVKTLDSIENALLKLLEIKPLDRITVTELAQTAMINKGTFYLHYVDIYDLYRYTLHKYIRKPIEEGDFFSDFFDDPELFLTELSAALDKNIPIIDKITRNRERPIDYNYLIENIKAKIYETGRIQQNITNDMKITMIFGSYTIFHNEYQEGYTEQMQELLAEMTKGLFPRTENA